jgi:predicted RNA-binding protein (virulence factor B family)
MTQRVQPEAEVLGTVYIDKSSRLCASMKGIYNLLSTDSPYNKDDMVTGRVYEFSDNFGTFIALDDKYSARIPNHEDHSFLRVGDIIDAKVVSVKADGKLDLTLREKAYIQMDADAEKILELLEDYAGVLPFTEKASPEVIKRETGLSKNAFKRAVGHLYKERKIDIADGKIRLV